jgi:hypothetical protein
MGILSSILKIKRNNTYKKGEITDNVLPLLKRCFCSAGGRLRTILMDPFGSGSQQCLEYITSMIPIMIRESLLCSEDETQSLDVADVYVRTIFEQVIHPVICSLSLDGHISSQKQFFARINPCKEIRMALLNLCLSSLHSMNENRQIVVSLSIITAHSTLEQMKNNHAELLSISCNENRVTQEQLLEKQILFKEMFWYLIAILNACFSEVPPLTEDQCPIISPLEQTVKNKIAVSLAGLLQRQGQPSRIGFVERNMLLAGIENAWLKGWFSTATYDALLD